MIKEPTSFLAVNVELDAKHEVLVFAHRQVVIIGGMLMTRTADGLKETGAKLIPEPPIGVRISKKPKTFENLVAYLEYRGLPPLFVRSQPRSARDGAGDTRSDLDTDADTGDPRDPGDHIAPGAPRALDAPALDKRRRALVRAKLTGKARIFAEQFTRFDDRTDPTSPTAQPEAYAVREILMNRVIRRGAWSKAGKPMPQATTVRAPLRKLPEITEGAFRRALEVFEATTGKGFDIGHFHKAFAAFTCGELALKPSPEDEELHFCGVPDSAYFFCFAEAALWFHEHGIQKPFWEKLLPLFVGAAETFKNQYFEKGEKKTRFAYAPGTPSGSPTSTALLKDIKAKYAGMSVDELAAKLGAFAAQAFAEEVNHLAVESGESPSTMRRITYELLQRGSPGVNGWREFDRAESPLQKALLEDIAARDRDKKVRYDDDPILQERELLDHIAARLTHLEFTDNSNGGPRPLRLEMCDPRKSTYNPDTGACDPLDFGASLRLRLALNSKTPCKKGAKPNTELELIVATLPAPPPTR
jgi:hypothetical protein